MSLDACAELVRRGDPDRFAAAMAAPVAARAILLPLYAFNLEVARAPFAAREPMIAEMRVQWWADILAEAAQGRARQHEVAGPLAALIGQGRVPVPVLQRLAEARRRDAWREPFADMAALSDYLEETGAGLMWAGAAALGAPAAAEPSVRALGWAAAAAAFLRAVPELRAREMPGVPGADHAGLAGRGLARLAEVRRGWGAGPGAPALIAGWQAGPVLRMAARDPSRVEEGRLALSEFARRGRLLWVAATGRW
ncbi:MAG: squalene/phytoene synthase family protein [Paracoccaceae bacterium]